MTIRRLLSFSLVLLLARPSAGAAPVTLDRTLRAMSGIEASFVHRFRPRGVKAEQVEKGKVTFGELPRMRWEYSLPEQKTFLFDGTRSYFYIPSDRQVSINAITDEQRSSYPFLFVGDPAARARNFKQRDTVRSGALTTRLEPRDKNAQLREIVLKIDSGSLLRSVEYTDRMGNRTIFEFSGHQKKPLVPETFRFTTPAGVDVVGDRTAL